MYPFYAAPPPLTAVAKTLINSTSAFIRMRKREGRVDLLSSREELGYQRHRRAQSLVSSTGQISRVDFSFLSLPEHQLPDGLLSNDASSLQLTFLSGVGTKALL